MGIYWFTADTHFGHSNILKYCKRPFKNIGEHDFRLVQLWNSRIKEEDTVFHLGDFCFKQLKGQTPSYYLNQLKGKIIVIKGNHDSEDGVKTCILEMRLRLGGKELLLVHNPSDIGYTDADLVLCGHIHQHWRFNKITTYDSEGKEILFSTDYCNVGVDVWNYTPISINEILREYIKWKRTSPTENLYPTIAKREVNKNEV